MPPAAYEYVPQPSEAINASEGVKNAYDKRAIKKEV